MAPAQLRSSYHLTPTAARRLGLVGEIHRRLVRYQVPHRQTLTTSEAAHALMAPILAAEEVEAFYALPLDARSRLIGSPLRISQGDCDGTDAGPRAFRKVVSTDRKVLTAPERNHLLTTALAAGVDAHRFIALGLLAGLRKAEILVLTWEQVDLNRKLLAITNRDGFTTKSARASVVPIADDLVAILTEARPDPAAGYVVAPTKQGDGRYRWDCRKTFKRIATDAGVPWLTIHGLRHSFATALAQGGTSLFKIRTWLGHASVSTTEIYAHAAEA